MPPHTLSTTLSLEAYIKALEARSYQTLRKKADEAGTALHFAVDANNIEVAKLLLANGADVAIRDVQGRTAMERATEKGRNNIRLYLD